MIRNEIMHTNQPMVLAVPTRLKKKKPRHPGLAADA
jgi:hypothetical protein